MSGWRWITGVLAVGVVALGAGTANAGRVAMTRTDGQRDHGVRPDKSVPYLTTGDSAFGAYSVAPRVYGSPVVDDPSHPQAKPVYNLPFYGGVQGFGDKSNGAVPRGTRITPR